MFSLDTKLPLYWLCPIKILKMTRLSPRHGCSRCRRIQFTDVLQCPCGPSHFYTTRCNSPLHYPPPHPLYSPSHTPTRPHDGHKNEKANGRNGTVITGKTVRFLFLTFISFFCKEAAIRTSLQVTQRKARIIEQAPKSPLLLHEAELEGMNKADIVKTEPPNQEDGGLAKNSERSTTSGNRHWFLV
jgi:hypothetical protein